MMVERVDVDDCMGQIRDVGYCILRNHFPPDAVEACNRAFQPLAEAYLAEHAENPNRGPNRHYIPLPYQPPLYHPAFFDDDGIHAIASGILGADMAIDQFASDTPYNGSVYQDVHADIGALFAEEPGHLHPPAMLAMNWPFVDVTPERGPFEVAERTHHLPREEALAKVESGEIPLKPLCMQVGDVLIRDIRTLHRGTPNRTDIPRVVAVVTFMRSWFCRDGIDTQSVPRSVWDGLTDREQHLMRRLDIDDSE